jgi:hypothetical protein
MANKLVIKNGVATGVYDDRLIPLYEALGVCKILRASTVEFNHDTRQWQARACDRQGTLIASGVTRSEVIKAEIDYLERGL